MAKICLVRPPMIRPRAAVEVSRGVPALGLAYIAAVAKRAGHEVSVVDGIGEALDAVARLAGTNLLIHGLRAHQIVERIPEDVDLIGISCMFSNEWIYSRRVIQSIIERFPTVPVIGGGEHFTAEPDYSFRTCPGLRALVLGEGEDTFVELVDALLRDAPLAEIKGIAYREDQRVIRTGGRPRIRAVDTIPWPSWEEMPLEAYLSAGLAQGSLRGRTMPMLASRGCPYECTFCSNPAMWTRRWLVRDPRDVIAEIKHWMTRYSVSHVEFHDLTTIVKRSWIISFAKLLIEADLGITWALPSGTRSEALDAEVVALLKRSGCHSLAYAPESGSPTTLKRIKKKIEVPRMLASMRASVRQGIRVRANLIVGLPGQTKREVAETYWFMVKMAWLGVSDVSVFPFVPYPGSELYDQVIGTRGIRKDTPEYEKFLYTNVYNEVAGMTSWSEHFSHRAVRLFSIGGFAWFYAWQFLFRPWRLFGVLVRLVHDQPVTMLDKIVEGLLRNFVTKRIKLHIPEIEPRQPREYLPLDQDWSQTGLSHSDLGPIGPGHHACGQQTSIFQIE